MLKKNFKKIDIAEHLSISTGFSLRLSKKLIDDLIMLLVKNIKSGKLNIKNLGSFKLVFKKKRVGRNPKTKEEHVISARNVVSFSPSRSVYSEINKIHE